MSLVGAAVMIAAQHIRLRLFDERRAEVLFGPDVLRTSPPSLPRRRSTTWSAPPRSADCISPRRC
jgi:hypothetical protein